MKCVGLFALDGGEVLTGDLKGVGGCGGSISHFVDCYVNAEEGMYLCKYVIVQYDVHQSYS